MSVRAKPRPTTDVEYVAGLIIIGLVAAVAGVAGVMLGWLLRLARCRCGGES